MHILHKRSDPRSLHITDRDRYEITELLVLITDRDRYEITEPLVLIH